MIRCDEAYLQKKGRLSWTMSLQGQLPVRLPQVDEAAGAAAEIRGHVGGLDTRSQESSKSRAATDLEEPGAGLRE